MTIWDAIILGIVEGLTEFLPVSSTGHLTIVSKMLGLQIDDPAITGFTAVIQIGAIAAVVLYFWKDIRRIAVAWVRGLVKPEHRGEFDHRMGYADEAKEIQDLYLDKEHREAMAAVPFGFLDSISLLGSKERMADKLTAYAEAGATTVALTPFASTVEQRIADLHTAAQALELAGVAG